MATVVFKFPHSKDKSSKKRDNDVPAFLRNMKKRKSSSKLSIPKNKTKKLTVKPKKRGNDLVERMRRFEKGKKKKQQSIVLTVTPKKEKKQTTPISSPSFDGDPPVTLSDKKEEKSLDVLSKEVDDVVLTVQQQIQKVKETLNKSRQRTENLRHTGGGDSPIDASEISLTSSHSKSASTNESKGIGASLSSNENIESSNQEIHEIRLPPPKKKQKPVPTVPQDENKAKFAKAEDRKIEINDATVGNSIKRVYEKTQMNGDAKIDNHQQMLGDKEIQIIDSPVESNHVETDDRKSGVDDDYQFKDDEDYEELLENEDLGEEELEEILKQLEDEERMEMELLELAAEGVLDENSETPSATENTIKSAVVVEKLETDKSLSKVNVEVPKKLETKEDDMLRDPFEENVQMAIPEASESEIVVDDKEELIWERNESPKPVKKTKEPVVEETMDIAKVEDKSALVDKPVTRDQPLTELEKLKQELEMMKKKMKEQEEEKEFQIDELKTQVSRLQEKKSRGNDDDDDDDDEDSDGPPPLPGGEDDFFDDFGDTEFDEEMDDDAPPPPMGLPELTLPGGPNVMPDSDEEIDMLDQLAMFDKKKMKKMEKKDDNDDVDDLINELKNFRKSRKLKKSQPQQQKVAKPANAVSGLLGELGNFLSKWKKKRVVLKHTSIRTNKFTGNTPMVPDRDNRARLKRVNLRPVNAQQATRGEVNKPNPFKNVNQKRPEPKKKPKFLPITSFGNKVRILMKKYKLERHKKLTGWYSETFEHSTQSMVVKKNRPKGELEDKVKMEESKRPLANTILYLLTFADVCYFHSVKSCTKIINFYDGDDVMVYILDKKAKNQLERKPLGKMSNKFQLVVMPNTYCAIRQKNRTKNSNSYSLLGITHIQGVTVEDIEMGTKEVLVKEFKKYEEKILDLIKEPDEEEEKKDEEGKKKEKK